MGPDLFAGVPVSDVLRAKRWFGRLFGPIESFAPNDTEQVWTLAQHRYLFVEERPEHAGAGHVTVFVDDLDDFVAAAEERGIGPHRRETYDNGVRKVVYQDPDGNEIGVGGGPRSASPR